MTSKYRYDDTPSIISSEIITLRNDRKLSYSDLTAREKRDYLFDEGIRKTAYEDEERPDVVFGIIRFLLSVFKSYTSKTLPESLLRISDELENPKRKLFHTYGTTAKIVFTPEPDTPYTGIFSEQAHGLARFSYAGPVIAIGIVPGLGLKFFIDGDNPSENLVVMRKLDRQQPPRSFFSTHASTSVFQNPFTNILPLPKWTNLIMRIVNQRFETVNMKGKGLHQSADNLAKVHINGEPVARDKINSPFRLIFRPTKRAKENSDSTLDFRDNLAKNIRPWTPIYEVFALSESQEFDLNKKGVTLLEDLVGGAKKVGTITTESEFIASKYGDYRLFFKHSDTFIQRKYRDKTIRTKGKN